MASAGLMHFKIYLLHNNAREVKRLAIVPYTSDLFPIVCKKIVELFPSVADKKLSYYWIGKYFLACCKLRVENTQNYSFAIFCINCANETLFYFSNLNL